MAISYLGQASNAAKNGANVAVDVSGIGLSTDDLLVVVGAVGDNDGNDPVEACSGNQSGAFTKVADLFVDDDTDTTMGVFWAVMGGTPDATVTYTNSQGNDSAAACVVFAFSGVDTTTPMDVTPTTATGTNSNIPNPPSINHNNPSGVATVIAGAFSHTSGAAVTATAPANYNNVLSDAENDTTDVTAVMAWRPDPGDPEDPGSFSPSIGDSVANSWCACTIALRPTVVTTTYTLTPEVDTVLRIARTKGITADTILSILRTKSISVDALMKFVITIDTELDTILKKLGRTRIANLDTILSIVRDKTLDLDARLIKFLSLTTSVELDAILRVLGFTWGSSVITRTAHKKQIWDGWKKVGGDPAVFDSSYGLLRLVTGDVFYSPVKDFGDSSSRSLTIDFDYYDWYSRHYRVERK
jgi:hypothetical protein